MSSLGEAISSTEIKKFEKAMHEQEGQNISEKSSEIQRKIPKPYDPEKKENLSAKEIYSTLTYFRTKIGGYFFLYQKTLEKCREGIPYGAIREDYVVHSMNEALGLAVMLDSNIMSHTKNLSETDRNRIKDTCSQIKRDVLVTIKDITEKYEPGIFDAASHIITDYMSDREYEKFWEERAGKRLDACKPGKNRINRIVNSAIEGVETGNAKTEWESSPELFPRHAIRARGLDAAVTRNEKKEPRIRPLWNEYLVYRFSDDESIRILGEDETKGCAAITAYSDIPGAMERLKEMVQDDMTAYLKRMSGTEEEFRGKTPDSILHTFVEKRLTDVGLEEQGKETDVPDITLRNCGEHEQQAAVITGMRDALIENGYCEEADSLQKKTNELLKSRSETRKDFIKLDMEDQEFRTHTALQAYILSGEKDELTAEEFLAREKHTGKIEEFGTGDTCDPEYMEKLMKYINAFRDELNHAKAEKINFREAESLMADAAGLYNAVHVVAHRNSRSVTELEKWLLGKLDQSVCTLFGKEKDEKCAADVYGEFTGQTYHSNEISEWRYIAAYADRLMNCGNMDKTLIESEIDVERDRLIPDNCSDTEKTKKERNNMEILRERAIWLTTIDCGKEINMKQHSLNCEQMYSKKFYNTLDDMEAEDISIMGSFEYFEIVTNPTKEVIKKMSEMNDAAIKSRMEKER